MLSRCPGSAKCPVRTTRPHPVLLFHTDAGLLCISSFMEHNVGCWGVLLSREGYVLLLLYLSPLPPPFCDPSPICPPKGWGAEKWGAAGRFLEGLWRRWGRG